MGSYGYRDGVRRVLPYAIAVFFFGVAYGVLARSAGLGAVPALVMSATTFAGSAQFAAVSVLGAGGGAAAAVSAAVLLNARYGPIGISAAHAFGGSRLRRFVEAQLLVDEAWAVSHVGGGRYDRRLIIGSGLGIYAAWIGGGAIGVAGGEALADPDSLGLDAAFPALFLALLVSQIEDRRAAVAALAGAAIALALIPVAPPGIPIVAAAAACLIGLRDSPRPAPAEPVA